LAKDYSVSSQSKGNATILQKSRQSSGLGTVVGAGQVGERRKKNGVLQGTVGGGLGEGGHESRTGQQNNVNVNHQSNL